jgi:DNA-binding response OmpR family regulator
MRILYLEDNPLIAFHVEQMIEDAGHTSVGSLASFSELKEAFAGLKFDAALVDIDLADGPTGPDAAAWLHSHGIPLLFVTGQSQVASQHTDISLGWIEKPISGADFAHKVELLHATVLARR